MKFPFSSRVGLVLGLMAVLGGGCSSNSPEPGKVLRAPKLPPAYPTAQAVPIDAALREAARAELVNAADSADPFIRAHAVEGLRDSVGTEARTTIVRLLSDAEPVVRFAAMMAAGELRLPEAHGPALRLLDDEDMGVRVAVRFTLHRLGDVRFSHDLEKYVRDMNPSVRRTTIFALGLLGEQSALKILKVMRRDLDPTVRQQVAEAMWRLGDVDGLEALVGYSVSHFPDDQMLAILALAAPQNQRVIEHVRGSLVTDYPEVNLVAARGMGMLGSDEGFGVALAGAGSTDPRQRHLAALALGAIGRSDAQAVLGQLLKDKDADVRVAAATALLQLK